MSSAHKVTVEGSTYLDPWVRTLCQLLERYGGQDFEFEARGQSEQGTSYIEIAELTQGRKVVADPVTLVRYVCKVKGRELGPEEVQRLTYIQSQVQRSTDRLFKLKNSQANSAQQDLSDELYLLENVILKNLESELTAHRG